MQNRFTKLNWWWPVISLWLGLLLISLYLVFLRHAEFLTSGFDLGIFTQGTWLMSQTLSPNSTLRGMNLFGDHFSLILLPITPFMRIFPSAQTLLILQTVAIYLSFIPLLLFVKTKGLWSRTHLILLLLILSGNIGILSAMFFDFHPEILSLPIFSLLLYEVSSKRYKFFWILLSILLLTKEDFGLYLSFLGLALWAGGEKQRGCRTFVISILSFWLIVLKIMPYFGAGLIGGGYLSKTVFGQSIPGGLELVTWIFQPLIKVKTVLVSLGVWLFLPLMDRVTIFLIIPLIAARFLLNDPLRWGLNLHYSGVLSLVLCWGFVNVLLNKKKILEIFGIEKILIFTLILEVLVIAHFSPRLNVTGKRSREAHEIKSVLVVVPSNASVSASSNLVPHLAARKEIYQFPEGIEQAEYVVLTLDRTTYPLSWDQFKLKVNELNKNPDYELQAEKGSTYLFKRINR
ncbi:hypothetical protein A3A70_03080 [candidate division WWE3 bacterium RIFCSPLOWO2_01_FULL_42_11]|uniref:DUF2079 domain-containing protein n=1 Tax=candidate division WWE3 bacterium RIFCSPLOWO2_01_FULL_42_11 TaxID=1802627 RepID=A0A1F4VSP7_UNCKA|nr:MAG: hypothetical protein A3A70_03080 [candidate division WWE3 bacterium RIFCSPLOWO2_01_FULL_42_11]